MNFPSFRTLALLLMLSFKLSLAMQTTKKPAASPAKVIDAFNF